MKKLIVPVVLTLCFMFSFIWVYAIDPDQPLIDALEMVPTAVWTTLGILLLAIEFVARVKPTWTNNAPTHKIIELLKWLSDKANNQKKTRQ